MQLSMLYLSFSFKRISIKSLDTMLPIVYRLLHTFPITTGQTETTETYPDFLHVL